MLTLQILSEIFRSPKFIDNHILDVKNVNKVILLMTVMQKHL